MVVFPAPVGPTMAIFLSRMHLGAEIVDDDTVPAYSRSETCSKSTLPLTSASCTGCSAVWTSSVLFQEFKHTLRGCRHRLHLVEHLCDLLHGLGEVLHVLDECLDITDGDGATNGEQSAGQCHSGIAEIADKHHDRLHQCRTGTGTSMRSHTGYRLSPETGRTVSFSLLYAWITSVTGIGLPRPDR